MNRYATEFYQPLTLGNYVFASAHGLIQRGPEYVFEGNQRARQVYQRFGYQVETVHYVNILD